MVASPKGLGSEKDYAGKDEQHIQKTDLWVNYAPLPNK
jgi:hypothetical protein